MRTWLVIGGLGLGVLTPFALGLAAEDAAAPKVSAQPSARPRISRPSLATRRSQAKAKAAAAGWDQSKEVAIDGSVSQPPIQGKPGRFCTLAISRPRHLDVVAQLAPWWYVESIGLAPKQGEPAKAVGLLRREKQERRLSTREVTWAGRVYRFRDEAGQPLWAGAKIGSWLPYTETWDPESMKTITGPILAVKPVFPEGNLIGMGPGVEIQLRESPGRISFVHLGPKWYVDQALPDLKVGQTMTVTGSSALWRDKHYLFASKLTLGEKQVEPRRADGLPNWPGGWQNWSGWGPGSAYQKQFDPKRMQTLSGKVVDSKRKAPRPDVGQGTVITVQAAGGAKTFIYLAPAWFLEQTGLKVARDDEVTVTGSLLPGEGRPVMMATSITIGGKRTELRSTDGAPVWLAPLTPAPAPQ